MDNYSSVSLAVEDLLEIIHSEGDSFEFLYCAVNDSVNWDVKPQSLNCFELSLYKGKNTQICTADKSFTLDQNCVTLFDIHKGFMVESAAGSYHYITFTFANSHQSSVSLLRMKKICELLEQGIKVGDDSTLEKLFNEIHREFLMRKPYFKQRISLLMQDMLVLLLRLYKPCNENGADSKNRKHSQIADKVLLYLGSHYTETVRLNDIAAFTGYTQRYIDTVFKHSTGYTIIHYLAKIRVESSRKALLSSNRSITEIALDCGFDSSSYFCKVFKKATGLSPSEYRESLQDYNHNNAEKA